MKDKQTIEAVRFMRVAAMLLVVLIHATGIGLANTSPDSPLYAYYLMLNRFTRFEGAVFVFLSGLVLFYTYEARQWTTALWKRFYKKRFLYILLPFVIWSVFYELFALATETRSYAGIAPIVERIVTGQSYYQLYFILILVQFYFLLPAFMWCYAKIPHFKWLMVPLGFTIELSMAYVTKQLSWAPPFPLFTVYIASFMLGGFVALQYKQLQQRWHWQMNTVMLVIATLLGIAYTYGFYMRNVLGDVSSSYVAFKALNIVYFLVACYVLFKLSLTLVAKGGRLLNRVAERLRIYSFGFYLVHPFILYIAERLIVATTPVQFHAYIWLRYVLVVIGCYVFIRVLHRILPSVSWLFGNLPKIKNE